MKDRAEIVDEYFEEMGMSVIKADGFDDCILGWAECAGKEISLVYNRDKVLETLCKDHNMDISDAAEYYEYNIAGAYVGPGSPIFYSPIDFESLKNT